MALRNGQGQRKKYLTLELLSVSNLVEDMGDIVSEFQFAKIGDKGSQRHKRGPKRPKYQTPYPEHPDTAQPVATTDMHANHLEAFHTSLRRRCAAYRRRTNMYAKKTGRLQERLDVYWIVHNFVRVHFTTRQVPAVALGILDHGFALHEVFLIQKVA